MNQKLSIAFLSLFLFCTTPDAKGQFFKKIFGTQERNKKPVTKKPIKQAPAAEAPVKRKKTRSLDYPATVKKDRYRIDVLIPLYLDELVTEGKANFKDHIPEKASGGINFYEGIKLATDTLRKSGYKLDVYVHDISSEENNSAALIQNNRLNKSDLIIGALPSSQIPVMAAFAKQEKINFISALSPSDAGITDNAYFTLLQPGLEKHCEMIRKTVLQKYPGKEMLLLYRTDVSLDSLACSYITGTDAHRFSPLKINESFQKKKLEKYFDSLETNVIVLPVMDNNLADSFFRKLNEWFPDYQFEIFGMPSLKFLNTLKKPDAYMNVALNFSSPYYFDVSTAAGLALAGNYRKEFGGKPTDMVFRGYEILIWYQYLLNKYGTIFNQKQNDNGGALFTRYNVKVQWKEYNELLYNANEHLYLFRYQGGSYIVEQL